MAETLLVLDRVSKRFGDFAAVRDMSLEILEGEFVAFIGPSGCGKTTTLRMIAGLEQPSAGAILLRGRRMNEVKPWQRDTPMVWQSLALFPYLSVVRNVEFGLKMRGMTARARRAKAMDWLDRLGIGHLAHRGIGLLSGGEKQRVALARALVTEPGILLLDEPLSALDAHLIVRMQAELAHLQRQLGITFIYVTHNQSEALAMANRVVIMKQGAVQQVGTPKDVYRAPANRFVAEFVGANNILAGRVDRVAGDRATIATSEGTFTATVPPDRALAAGDRVSLVVSADRITLSAEGGVHENTLEGSVIGEQFVGALVTLYLESSQGTEFRVQKQQHELEALDLAPGKILFASWSATHTYILPGE